MASKPISAALFKLVFLAGLLLLSLSCRMTEPSAQESPIICITFDDGSSTVYTNALPLLQNYGYSATVFINSGTINTGNNMSVSQLQSLKQQYGWEVGGHSLNHEHLGQLNLEAAASSISRDFQNLTAWDLNPKSFALPYGECPHEYYPLITAYYSIIRGSSDFPLIQPIDPLNLSYTSYQSSWDVSQISARITRGIIDHEDLIILGFHTVHPDVSISGINCSPQTFSMILDFIHSRGLRVMTISQAISSL